MGLAKGLSKTWSMLDDLKKVYRFNTAKHSLHNKQLTGNVLEHLARVVLLSMAIAEVLDRPVSYRYLCIKALLHDIIEYEIGDINRMVFVENGVDERKLMESVICKMDLPEDIKESLLDNFTLESKIVELADILDVYKQASELYKMTGAEEMMKVVVNAYSIITEMGLYKESPAVAELVRNLIHGDRR